MDIKPFLHEHYLLFDKYKDQKACCDHCNQRIVGWAFTCETCKFWLHESCAKQQLPGQIPHPLHSQHLLTLHVARSFYICDRCLSLTQGCIYSCKKCNLNLDLICASLTTPYKTPQEASERSHHRHKTIQYFSHSHRLSLFNYRKVRKDEYSCRWCEKLLSGMPYGCLRYPCSSREVFFHESCLFNMPSIILKHHFHPSHPLHIHTFYSESPICNACKDRFESQEIGYTCQKCQFHLHVNCVTFQPSLKHELHEHHLTYFQIKKYTGSLQCKVCYKNIRLHKRESVFYRCVDCDFNLHLHCASLPFTIKHEYHRHELTLMDSFIEDGSNDCYCDICEKERKPKHHVYCCKKCTFVAHIGCALHRSIDNNFEHGSTSSLVDREVTIGKVTGQKGTEIDYFDHQHPLSFYEVNRKNKSFLCNACTLEIHDQAYVCKYGCKYYLHKACTKLSHELLHPLHPQHSLKLITRRFKFTCDECRQWFYGFCYMCYACDFKLYVKCATLSVPENESQRLKEMETRSKLCPFNQHHKLNFFIYGSTLRFYPECHFCDQQLQGPSYECIYCEYKLHESCLEFPLEMQLHFHPLHSLRLIPFARKTCLVCKYLIYRKIRYSCLQCDLHVHPYCAKSQKRTVKSKSHMHNLYYFGPNAGSGFYRDKKTCDECKERFSRTPFYFCMECGIMLHIKCTVPHSVKSKYHIHPLTLKDYFKEDDSGEYYCDICEEERDPQHHSYYCAKCEAPFVAHIDCGLNSVEENAEAEEPSTNLASDFDHT